MPYKDPAEGLASKKRYYQANKERLQAYGKLYFQQNKDKLRVKRRENWKKPNAEVKERREIRRLATAHKTTITQIKQLMTIKTCPLCKTRPARDIDHCHKTGRVRGRLCHRCNIGLGHFEDNPDLFFRAADYLLNHGGVGGI